MNTVKVLFEILKENPRIFVRKFAITVQTGVWYFIAMLFLMIACLSEEVPQVGKYLGVGVLLYICLILPVNIMIRLWQARQKEMDFIDYILEEECEQKEQGVRIAKKSF